MELEREKKWLKMLKNWKKIPKEKLKNRWKKGLPNVVRGIVGQDYLASILLRKNNKGNITYVPAINR